MQYPTLRYGNPTEFRFYAQFIPKRELAKRLRRSVRTIDNWLNEREKLPWWVPEILRLQQMEHAEMMRQMGFEATRRRLGLVTGDVIEFAAPKEKLQQDAPAPASAECFARVAV